MLRLASFLVAACAALALLPATSSAQVVTPIPPAGSPEKPRGLPEERERELPPMEDRVSAERARNQAAYERDYLPKRPTLLEHHRGKWIAIIGGKVYPRDGLGHIAPTTEIAALDATTREAHPKARHRFVIRIGDEGDATWGLGMTQKRFTLGRAFLTGVADGFVHAAAGGFWIVDGDKKTNVWSGGAEHDAQPFVAPPLAPPTSLPTRDRTGQAEPEKTATTEKTTKLEKQIGLLYTNLCEGTALLGTEELNDFDLAMWELPGTIRVRGLTRAGALRRVYLRFRFEGTAYDFIQHVALWPAPEAIKVEATKIEGRGKD